MQLVPKSLSMLAIPVIAAMLVGCESDNELSNVKSPPQDKAKTRHVVAPSVVSRSDAYVGDQVCAKCHVEIARSYQHTGMARSWRPVGRSLPDGGQAGRIADAEGRFCYRVLKKDGSVYQQETLCDDAGKYQRLQQADYWAGSGKHAQSMIAEDNGYLFLMPIVWYATQGQWGLSPGYELRNHRFNRPILQECVACHRGRAEHRPLTRNRYHTPITSGIGCGECHGPGREHVEFRTAAPGHSAKSRSGSIVNPRRLDAEQANSVCLRCHLQGDSVVYQPGSDAFSFQPGQRLSEHRLDFLIERDVTKAGEIASHGAGMLHSRCYQQSGGKLTCIRCHDPHQPLDSVSRKLFDSKCMQCHNVDSCNRPQPASVNDKMRGCVDCHMPRQNVREGHHLAVTDHRIPRSPGRSKPPEPLTPNAQVTLIPAWPTFDATDARLGAAYVRLHETMGPQLPAIERGIQLLNSALERDGSDSQARFWLASAEISRYRSQKAISLLQRVLRDVPDWLMARFRLAIAYDQLRRYPEAISEYERVIQTAPDWMEPYPLVVRLHLFRQDAGSAIRLLKQQLSYQNSSDAYVNLAVARHLQNAPLEECLRLLDTALKLDPQLVTAYVTRGHLLLAAGKIGQAEAEFRTALKFDENSKEASAGLQNTLKSKK